MLTIEKGDIFNDDFIYDHTVVSYLDEDEIRLFAYKDEDLKEVIREIKIVTEEVYLDASKYNFKVCSSDTGDLYLKRQSVLGYEPGSCNIRENLLREIQILETLGNSHPSICEYVGCYVKGGFVKGVYLKRYSKTLRECIDEGIKLDRLKVLSQLSSALSYIHSMGLVHDDVNPSNVMIDDECNALLVDFDSCKRSGLSRNGIKSGTMDWDLESEECSIKNDIYCLGLITKYILEDNNDANENLSKHSDPKLYLEDHRFQEG